MDFHLFRYLFMSNLEHFPFIREPLNICHPDNQLYSWYETFHRQLLLPTSEGLVGGLWMMESMDALMHVTVKCKAVRSETGLYEDRDLGEARSQRSQSCPSAQAGQ